MRIFNHPGCASGQCIWQQLGMACLTTDEITDVKNHITEKRREWELRNEARRLLEEQGIHGFVQSETASGDKGKATGDE